MQLVDHFGDLLCKPIGDRIMKRLSFSLGEWLNDRLYFI